MPSTEHHLQLHCLLLGLGDASKPPDRDEGRLVERTVRLLLDELDLFAASPRKLREPTLTRESVQQEIEKVDFVLADVSEPSAEIFFYLGIAKAQGKTTVALREVRPGETGENLFDRQVDIPIPYESGPDGQTELTRALRETLASLAYSQDQENRILLGEPLEDTVHVPWSRLSATGHENLCFDLLLRDGLVAPRWLDGTNEVDLIGLRPMPEGYELCLVSIGAGLVDPFQVRGWLADIEPVSKALLSMIGGYDLAREDGKILLELVFFWSPVEAADEPFDVDPELLSGLRPLTELLDQPFKVRRTLWDKRRLESRLREEPLVQTLHLVEESLREQAPRRFTIDELFRRTTATTNLKVARARRLEETYGIDPGRQWQEQAYTMTHSIGNAVFAVETYLECFHDLLDREQFPEILDNVDASMLCIEKAKKHLFRFKQIARYDKPKLQPVDLRPRLENSLDAARARGVRVELVVHDDEPVLAEPDDLDELFDEIVINSQYWLKKSAEEPKITATVKRATPDDLPRSLSRHGREFLWIRYQDSGPGVPKEYKERIFKLSFSKSSQGMGYGLALVRKNLRRFGGDIVENGLPGRGVQFDMFLPIASERPPVPPAMRTQPIPEVKIP